MKAVLHVGPHKTGTTSLQHFLFDNRNQLKEDGVWVPSIRSPDNTPNSWYLLYAFTRSDERAAKEYHNSIRAGHTAETCRLLRDKYTSLLRSELASTQASTESPRILAISSEELVFLENDEINSLYDFLLSYCQSVEVIYYYRSPFDRLRSDLQQGCKGGSLIARKILDQIPCQDSLRLARLKPSPSNLDRVQIHIEAYLRGLENESGWDIRKDFCRVLETDHKALNIPSKDPGSNSNMSMQMFSVVQDINRMMPAMQPDKKYNKLRHHLHDAIDSYKWTSEDTPFLFSEDDMSSLLKRKDDFKRAFVFAESQPWINISPKCYNVFNAIGSEATVKGISGSAIDYKPELTRDYYANIFCHFWSYLRKVQMQERQADAKQRSAGIRF